MAAFAIRLRITNPDRSLSGENSSLGIEAPLSIVYNVCAAYIRRGDVSNVNMGEE
jgi:hypothetical protein